MALDPPYSTGIFETIVDCHFGGVYLVVLLVGGNDSFNLFSAAPPIGAADISSTALKKGVKLLDSAAIPNSNNSGSGFGRCIVYAGDSIEDAYLQARGRLPPDFNDGVALELTEFPAVNNSCPLPAGVEIPPGLNIGGVEFGAFAVLAQAYLYSIPEGDGLLTLNVSGLIETSSTNGGDTFTNGSGEIVVYVFSRTRGTIKHLSQLSGLFGGAGPWPTEDDNRIASITHDNQGKFVVNVHQNNDPADAQIDNYGESFQPYKVTLSPAIGADGIPFQPPIRLPK